MGEGELEAAGGLPAGLGGPDMLIGSDVDARGRDKLDEDGKGFRIGEVESESSWNGRC